AATSWSIPAAATSAIRARASARNERSPALGSEDGASSRRCLRQRLLDAAEGALPGGLGASRRGGRARRAARHRRVRSRRSRAHAQVHGGTRADVERREQGRERFAGAREGDRAIARATEGSAGALGAATVVGDAVRRLEVVR